MQSNFLSIIGSTLASSYSSSSFFFFLWLNELIGMYDTNWIPQSYRKIVYECLYQYNPIETIHGFRCDYAIELLAIVCTIITVRTDSRWTSSNSFYFYFFFFIVVDVVVVVFFIHKRKRENESNDSVKSMEWVNDKEYNNNQLCINDPIRRTLCMYVYDVPPPYYFNLYILIWSD